MLNTLSSSKSHTHSVCRCVLVGTLQPKQQHFKWVWLIGGGGLREGLLVNWQSREYGALSLSPTPMLSFPSLPLTNHSLHSFSVAGLILPFIDVISSLSPIPSSACTRFSFLIFLMEYRSFKQSILQLLSLPYLTCLSVLVINHSLIHLANYFCQQQPKKAVMTCLLSQIMQTLIHTCTHPCMHCRHTNQICLKCGTLKEEKAPVYIKYSCDVWWDEFLFMCFMCVCVCVEKKRILANCAASSQKLSADTSSGSWREKGLG